MKNYAEFYNKLTKTFQDKPAAIRSLQVINSLLTKVMYLVYPLLLIHLFINTPDKLPIFILIPGLSFILVSLGRHLLNAPRPYETWNITPLIPKDTKGHSFPSRHVFSASIISVAVLTQSSFLGVILLILSLVIAFCRVLGGVHYPHDVAAGYLIGLICGFLLFLF